MTEARTSARTDVLQRLVDLTCEASDAAATTAYVIRREQLLAALARLPGPWQDDEVALLHQALASGERAMQAMVALRQDVLRRLEALGQRRKFMPAATHVATTRPRRTL